MTRTSISRRQFLAGASIAAAGAVIMPPSVLAGAGAGGSNSFRDWLAGPAFDSFVQSRLAAANVPGVSVGIIYGGQLLRTAGYGWANIDAQRPMQPNTIMNIASVTKTITCTAVMQLCEQGKFGLDDDINRYLPFQIVHPAHPHRIITIRHLLTHTSSIIDGPAYTASYACGDPATALADWLRAYLVAGGATYSEQENFGAWRPGKQWNYSNVAFGVLGLLVESVSGVPYGDYCIQNIFAPLGMTSSRFLLAEMPAAAHATPYSYIEDGDVSQVPLLEPTWTPPSGQLQIQVPHCLYSFATPPDGLARTTAAELSRFVLAYMHGGTLEGTQILRRETVSKILSDQHVNLPGPGKRELQGLAWGALGKKGSAVWNHSGGDPGVSTLIGLRQSDGRGVVVLTNSSTPDAMGAIVNAVFGNEPVV